MWASSFADQSIFCNARDPFLDLGPPGASPAAAKPRPRPRASQYVGSSPGVKFLSLECRSKNDSVFRRNFKNSDSIPLQLFQLNVE